MDIRQYKTFEFDVNTRLEVFATSREDAIKQIAKFLATKSTDNLVKCTYYETYEVEQ